MKNFVSILAGLLWFGVFGVMACDDSSDGPPAEEIHVVDNSIADTFAETNEVDNSSRDTPELSEYTLDSSGLIITGSFENGNPTRDIYLFNTGEFQDVDVVVIIDNAIAETLSISLDAFVDDGYSTLGGLGYFYSAWLSNTNVDYILSLNPSSDLEGKTYTIEIVGTD
jgi:hypothetical protein